MKRKLVRNIILVVLGVLVILASGCTDSSDSENAPVQETTNEEMTNETENADEVPVGVSDPMIDPADFVEGVDNPYFPLEPGTTLVYEGQSELAEVDVQMNVTGQSKEVMGVDTTVVKETEWIDGEIVEEAYSWYAQDTEGNVWYLGRDAKQYDDNGEVIATAGSWEAGVDGAQPGIVMLGDPQPGLAYRQVYYEDQIEDQAAVVSLNESVTVPYDSFENVLLIQQWSDLEMGYEANKYYAKDIGLVKEEAVRGAIEQLELVTINTE